MRTQATRTRPSRSEMTVEGMMISFASDEAV